MNNDCSYKSSFELLWVLISIGLWLKTGVCRLCVLNLKCLSRVISVRYCLTSQNGQEVENWRSVSRTEIRTTDLAAMEITVDHQDDNYEVQRSTD
ncbi:hypothetical protein AVEN_73537-1 [Araneus ventricosus]|uniref:Uncharacterized protein n=1 Tax=Araneus ventricosus TaxID=182803 RepID=A0A4Y2JGM8_ARAVE|nr:hypothetical protein AVEN_73537-1 [Araneus ventricosus]